MRLGSTWTLQFREKLSTEWLTWIRDEIQKSEAKAMASLQKEMERGFLQKPGVETKASKDLAVFVTQLSGTQAG